MNVYFYKLKNYPLFFNKNYGLNSTIMGLKYLYSDIVRLIKKL